MWYLTNICSPLTFGFILFIYCTVACCNSILYIKRRTETWVMDPPVPFVEKVYNYKESESHLQSIFNYTQNCLSILMVNSKIPSSK